MNTPEILKSLFHKVTWDYAVIYVAGKPATVIDKGAKYRMSESGDLFIVEDPSADNPFLPAGEIPEDFKGPRTCTQVLTIEVQAISCVETGAFNKIATKKGPLIIAP